MKAASDDPRASESNDKLPRSLSSKITGPEAATNVNQREDVIKCSALR